MMNSIQPEQIIISPNIDPDEKQRIASDPAQSVWVDASAGTGKTKILTDRVLRLLLSEENRPASPPERIVCITFTKAAASEMSLRVTKELSTWSICPKDILKTSLRKLMGYEPSPKQMRESRTLFARVIDVQGGLKIMTIHAFCQSILQKFPLEAGLSPNFTVLTEHEAKDAIQTARTRVFSQAKNDPLSPLGQAVQNLSIKSSDMHLMKFLEDALKEKQQILHAFDQIVDIAHLKPALLDAVHLPQDISEIQLISSFFEKTPIQDIKSMIEAYDQYGTSAEKDKIYKLSQFLYDSPHTSKEIDLYSSFFLTAKKTLSKKIATKKVLENFPDIEFMFLKEAERCLDFIEDRAKLYMVEDTYDFLCVSQKILEIYMQEKQLRNALDFDDLIQETFALLKNSQTAAQWVLFKLDQGIDHLLIDEAQDTNPDQWSVIEALSDEFFHGESSRDSIERTLFVVGDEKQSIYSFQKADPDIFRNMQAMFKEKVTRASKQWIDVPLTLSFRSTEAVLTLVDLVFAQENMRQSLTAQAIEVEHSAYRSGMAGHVELWPLIYGEEIENLDPWPIPYAPVQNSSAANLMAQKIAGTIKHWIDEGRLLESENRPIRAGDIMILLKKRSSFQKTLVRSLKDHNIPVGGLDRMVLQDHIAAQDILAALEFGLLPQDDLILATFLKSPLMGWSENQLMEFILSHQKSSSLWSVFKENKPDDYEYLLEIHNFTLKKRPFDVISFILNMPCPSDPQGSGLRAFIKRLGQDAIDPLQELLNVALDVEREKGLSLQSFVHTLKRETQDVKREMDDESDSVRIMTVHGSKGLQAPIVFLPDTIRTSSARDNAQQAGSKLLWQRRSGLPYPFWAARSTPDLFKKSKEAVLEHDDREYQRLLYVALTRARDELYIGGYTGKTKYLEDSWYCKIEEALKAATKEGVRTPCKIMQTENVIAISNAQTNPASAGKTHEIAALRENLPSWIFQKPRAEPSPARPLQPSRPSGDVYAMSPLEASTEYRFKRGNIIHTLLEFLPEKPEAEREMAAHHYVSQSGHGFDREAQKDIVEETLKIIKDPIFSPVFQEGSRAEVSISGQLENNTVINGQIDRLIVTENEIFIVDYKTNRPPPNDPKDIPIQYKKQMQAYKDVLASIYPHHTIRTALLWTNIPVLMEIL